EMSDQEVEERQTGSRSTAAGLGMKCSGLSLVSQNDGLEEREIELINSVPAYQTGYTSTAIGFGSCFTRDQYYPIETGPATADRSTQAQAIVILWKTGEKNRLLSVLDSLNSNSNEHNTSHSRIVIVDADSEEELEEWNEICFENGFECHMKLQCPGNVVLGHPSTETPSSSSTLVSPHPSSPENHVGFGNDFAETISGGLNQVTNPDLVNQDQSLIGPDSSGPCATGPVDNGFEDDFSDFVSAQTSSTRWDDDHPTT
ncbi:hypothetical protein PSTT_13389, partial [Puccinia striiformis]